MEYACLEGFDPFFSAVIVIGWFAADIETLIDCLKISFVFVPVIMLTRRTQAVVV